MFQSAHLAPYCVTGPTTEKGLALSPLLSQIPLSLFFSKMNSLSSPVWDALNSPLSQCSLVDLFQCVHASVILGREGLDPALWMWPHQYREQRKDHLLWPAGNTFAKAGQSWKIIEFTRIAVANTALTGFRNRTRTWHCLIYGNYCKNVYLKPSFILLFVSKFTLK